MNKNVFHTILLFCTILLLYPGTVFSTVTKRMNLQALINTSADIILGEIISLKSYRSQNGRYIMTDVTVNVRQGLKGSTASRIIVTILGGTVDGITTSVVGSPRFCTAETVILFLNKITGWSPDKSIHYAVVGLSQGKYELRDPRSDNELFVSSATSAELTLLPDKSGDVTPPGGEKGITIQEILTTISASSKREEGK